MNLTSLKHWALFSAPLLLMLLAIWLGFDNEPDVAIYFKEHSANSPLLATILKFLTDWSNPVFYVFYAFLLIQAFRKKDFETRRYIFILLGMQVIVGVLAVHFTKSIIGRPRPNQSWYFTPITDKGTYHSLPSGHTTEIIGWSLPLALKKHQTLLTLLLGILVGILGFSRIYLGWHHPTDVFFAWMLGSFTAFATMVLAGSTLFRKKATA